MSIIGYYDGTFIHVKESLQANQKVLAIPIKSEKDLKISAAGGLHKYANLSLIS